MVFEQKQEIGKSGKFLPTKKSKQTTQTPTFPSLPTKNNSLSGFGCLFVEGKRQNCFHRKRRENENVSKFPTLKTVKCSDMMVMGTI